MILKINYKINQMPREQFQIGEPPSLVAVEVSMSSGRDGEAIVWAKSVMPLPNWEERVEQLKAMFEGRSDISIVDVKHDEESGALGIVVEPPEEEKDDAVS